VETFTGSKNLMSRRTVWLPLNYFQQNVRVFVKTRYKHVRQHTTDRIIFRIF
jgi:hypothetical protein